MKFTCSQKQLLKALNIVSKAVSNKTTRPILKCILISAEKDSVTFTASDMDITIKHTVTEDIYIENTGVTAVSAKLFMDIIRKLPANSILVESIDSISLRVVTDNSEFTITTADYEEFPVTKSPDNYFTKLLINKNILKDMIRKTSFAASVEEAKGIIVGVLIEFEKDSLNMIALDGFRMAVNREPVRNDIEQSIIINAGMLNDINKIISEDDSDEDVIISPAGNFAQINLDNTEIYLRLLEGEFIRYRDIIPSDFRTKVYIDRNDLISAVERASLLSNDGKNNLIRVNITNNLLTVTSRSDAGNVKEQIIIDKQGEDIEIGFNSKYLLDTLKVIDDDTVLFNFNTSVTPALIKPIEGNIYDMLVLPVRLF